MNRDSARNADAWMAEVASEWDGLEGRRSRVRPLRDDDVAWAYQLMLGGDALFRWRYRGTTVAPETFAATLAESVFVQGVIENLTGEHMGVLVVHDLSAIDRHAFISVVLQPQSRNRIAPVEAFHLTVDWLLGPVGLHRVCVEAVDYNLEQFGRGLSRWFTEEARMVDHVYFGGRHFDFVVLGLLASEWRHSRPSWLRKTTG